MNNKFSVLITEPAQKDILEIISFIAKENPKAAVGVLNIFSGVFKMLKEFPAAGVRKTGINDTSVLVYITRKRYSIVYRVNQNAIEILRVLTRYQDLFAIL